MKNKKLIFAYVIIIVLLALIFYTTYIRFFHIIPYDTPDIKVENSSNTAINTALDDIVNNFNNNTLIEEYKKSGININAIRKNYSIYISYQDDKLTTYEFNYSTLNLSINISNTEDNLKKFNVIYEILLKATQTRLLNNNVDEEIKKIVNKEIEFDGIVTKENDNIISYSIDITKKINKGSE